jgi:D-serine deaminase-like pyridoxal phosphate-dependent protein
VTGYSIFDDAVPTPFAFVDLDVLERNIAAMAEAARQAGVGLRPHVKTHKTVEIAQRQLAAGAIGLTVAKLGEASAFVEAGVRTSFMIAQPFVGADKLRSYLRLLESCEVLVCLDDLELAAQFGAQAAAEGSAVHAVLIVDAIGYERFGVPPERALDAAGSLAALPGVRFRGVRSYPGRLYEPLGPHAARELAVRDAATLAEVAGALAQAGLACDVVSTGNTPAARRLFDAGIPDGITELRPGNYVFTDRMQVSLGSTEPDRTALRVVTSVVSAPAAGRAVVDAGFKTLSATRVDGDAQYGEVMNRSGVTVEALWEECGRVRGSGLRTGDRLVVMPNHACEVPNLAEVVYFGRDGGIEGEWRPVARGKVW